MDDTPRLLHKKAQTAHRLNVCVRQVTVLADRGELELVKDGHSAFIVVASEDAYVERLRAKAEKARRERLQRRQAKELEAARDTAGNPDTAKAEEVTA